MAILELDFGNSSLKWRLLEARTAPVARRIRYSDLQANSFDSMTIERVRVASVLDLETTWGYLGQLGISAAEIASSAQAVAGFTNAYKQPERLGVDRWLAALAAKIDAGDRACLIIDCGTAITVDYMDSNGVFEGGYILAGRQLLENSLVSDTSQVRFQTPAAAHVWPAWPKQTAEAVQWGVDFVLQAVVERAIKQAGAWQQDGDFAIYLTGGDAARLAPQLENTVQYRPDLVLDGLAVALP